MNPVEVLAKSVAAKLEDGDHRGAVYLSYSYAVLAVESDSIFIALQQKHHLPASNSHSQIPPVPTNHSSSITVSEDEIICAINT